MWQARVRGVVENLPRLGYWLSNEPLPPGAEEAAKKAQALRRVMEPGKRIMERIEAQGRPRGRPRGASLLLLPPEKVEAAKVMLIGNQKSLKEIRELLGGISQSILNRYFPDGREGLRKQYPELAAQNGPPPRRKHTGGGPGPRPSSAILETAAQMYQRGDSVDEIAPELGVPRSSIYRHLKKLGILTNRKPGPKPNRPL